MVDSFEDLDCNTTYEQSVEISDSSVTISAICFESENDVRKFERTVELP